MRALSAVSIFGLTLSLAGPAAAQTALPPVHANAVIPQPPPSAPLASWVGADKRATMSVDAGGATLRGWSYAGADPALPTVLFFNGNGAAIADLDGLYRSVAALGPRIVVFDYRGYGFSAGTADVAAFEQDALVLYDAVAKDAGRSVVVYGFSLGAPIAAFVAAHRPVEGVILAAPMANAREELPIFAKGRGAPVRLRTRWWPLPMPKRRSTILASSRAPPRRCCCCTARPTKRCRSRKDAKCSRPARRRASASSSCRTRVTTAP